MKHLSFLNFFAGILIISTTFSCIKSGLSRPVGGELPTNYIIVKDSSFTPPILKVVSGSSITFVNNTSIAHTIISDDTLTIKAVSIASGTSYFFKKDTSGTFLYHCTLHPNARGTIIITP